MNRNARLLVPMLRFPVDEAALLRLVERGVGGFCVFAAPAAGALAGLIARLQAAAPHPLLIASDLERGAGQQVAGLTSHPCAAALDADAAEAAGALTAIEARPLGITMTFAPVCDVVSNVKNPIIQDRAFRNPAACAPRFVDGARAWGLRTCAKHFPGHGATEADSHSALPLVNASADVWRSRDLPPFAAAIAAGVDSIMTAHIDCPALTGEPGLPATLSRRVMTDLLRDEMGFSGLLVTDALLMEGVRGACSEAEAAKRSIRAGCDVVLCPEDVEGVLVALAELDDADVDAALTRLAACAQPLPGDFSSDAIESAAHRAGETLAMAAAASVRVEGSLPIGPGPHPLRIFDLHGGGEPLARRAASAGIRYERHAQDGSRVGEGGETGLAKRCVAILRRDKAWGAGVLLPATVRAAAQGAELLILLGPKGLGAGLASPARVCAPGEDPATLDEVLRRAFALK